MLAGCSSQPAPARRTGTPTARARASSCSLSAWRTSCSGSQAAQSELSSGGVARHAASCAAARSGRPRERSTLNRVPWTECIEAPWLR